ncbi:OmpA family protein [Candidatus Kapabacteria bacterium]|nr:OmpA family protein [Candidatus Kapabacteria bacterium]
MKLSYIIILIFSIVAIESCSNRHVPKTGFEFQQETYSADTTLDKIYIVDTKSVDSINPKQVIYDVFRINYQDYPNNIELYARPYDSLGNFVTNMAYPYKTSEHNYFPILKEKLGKVYGVRVEDIPDFNVREFGKDDSIAFNIMLTLDYSGSISQMMETIKEATEIFVKLKYPYDKVGINSFNNKFSVKVPLASDTSNIMNIFRAVAEDDMGLFSAVYNAAYNSLKLFEGTNQDTPRFLVLFSDGDDNYSQVTIREVIKLANELNVNIFTVAFGYSIDENLEYLSSYTGGKSYKAYSKEELIAIFRDIYNSLRNYYLITYKPPLFFGWHKAFTSLDIPGRDSMMIADVEYNTGIGDLSDSSDIFRRPILFEFDKDSILAESFNIIDEIVDAMYIYPRLRLEVQGHTDNKGSAEYNQKLSERRAKAVVDAFLERDIHPRRLRYRGFGLSRPIASNNNEEGQSKNRRTEFKIIAK